MYSVYEYLGHVKDYEKLVNQVSHSYRGIRRIFVQAQYSPHYSRKIKNFRNDKTFLQPPLSKL